LEVLAMSKFTKWLGVAALGVGMTTATGCVSQKEFKQVKLERDEAIQQRDQAQQESEAARAEADSFKNQLGAMQDSQSEEVQNLSTENEELQSELTSINQKYSDVVARGGAPLPSSLISELTRFAGSNKDFIEFDASRGIIRFKSDVSFAPGSADLTPKAKDAIEKLAKILSTGEAAKYELMVAGHTDSEKVSKPRTIQAGNKDNWYLSAHRAITVGEELHKFNVSSFRMAMVGYADQKPIGDNATDKGRALNRRVEVLILPTVAKQLLVEKTPTTKPVAKGKKANKDEFSKTETGPALNK
jgi:chemotaxis protein MotB